MNNKIRFKTFKEFVETDISNWKEDEIDESTLLNVNKENYEYLKQTLTEEQLKNLVRNNPSWLEFMI